MPEIQIKAEHRTEFGKGAARRIRRSAKVPAVLYGHGSQPEHVTLPGHDLMLALKHNNALLEIDVDGTKQLVLPKQVQRDPIKGFIEHADLLIVLRGEKVVVELSVSTHGEPVSEGLVVTETASVPVEAEATHIPDGIDIDVDDLPVGARVTAADLSLPDGVSVQLDAEHLILHIVAAPTAAELDAELSEAEADAGIERDEAEPEESELPADEATDQRSEDGQSSVEDA